MNTSPVSVNKNLLLLARTLERLERRDQPVDAGQYRTLVARLAAELEASPRDAALDAVLEAFPAAAELYENLNYQHAGLVRSGLERALSAEVAARHALDAIRAR